MKIKDGSRKRMERSDCRLICKDRNITLLVLTIPLVLGFIGSLGSIEASTGANPSILPLLNVQNSTNLMPPAMVKTSIQPVLLAPITVSGDNIYIVWPDNRTLVPNDASTNSGRANWEIFFVRSPDLGQTFAEPINLSNSANGTSMGAEIAINNKDFKATGIYVTFWDNKTGENNPYFVFSNDGGVNFSKPIMLNVTALR
jgi:hypothetical protein